MSVMVDRKTVKERLDEDGGVERHCPKCDEWWPADREFFYGSKEKLHYWCKACYLTWRRERRECSK